MDKKSRRRTRFDITKMKVTSNLAEGEEIKGAGHLFMVFFGKDFIEFLQKRSEDRNK